MFWYWVGGVLVVVLALAAWSTWRSRRIRGSSGVRSEGALNGPRDGIGESDAARAQAEMNSSRPDHHPGGSF